MEFAIVDIETNGSHYSPDCITEIGIVITDGKKILEKYETLIDPQEKIPRFITYLTGITDEMVEGAPLFEDVAYRIKELLDNRIFVAHNVNFDYKIIKNHMDRIGLKIPNKRICTVRLSRKIIPGYPSYSLGKLSASLGLKHQNAHRAMGDAKVTAELFHILFEKNNGQIEEALKGNSRESTLPANLSKKTFKALPTKTGVYYFHNAKGKVIYIGKAKNIKKRVSSHFTGKSNLDKPGFLSQIFDITYELTGNEVVASLMEEAEIKKMWPDFNNAQKAPIQKYAVYKYEDRNSKLRLGINKISSQYHGIMQFPTLSKARNWLIEKVEQYELKPSLCGLKMFDNNSVTEESHAKNINRFLKEYLANEETVIWKGKGRYTTESSFVLLEKGTYKGFGFIDNEVGIQRIEEFKDYLIPQHETPFVRKVLSSTKYNKLKRIKLLG